MLITTLAVWSLLIQALPSEPPTLFPSLSKRSNAVWAIASLLVFDTLKVQRVHLEQERTRLRPDLPSLDPRQESLQKNYQILPTLMVDQEIGYTFPKKRSAPLRSSWFRVYRDLTRLRSKASLNHWIFFQSEMARISNQIRYLLFWPKKIKPLEPTLREGLDHFNNDASNRSKTSRLSFLPRRGWLPQYLPRELPVGKEIPFKIWTDIEDSLFLKEFEGAVDIHWNQSPWAKKNQIRFAVDWKHIKPSQELINGRITLEQHVTHLIKSGHPTVTTGAQWTFVRGPVMVLSPGQTPIRVIAHEFGHLLGFEDCYFRDVEEKGFFGLFFKEWENPYFRDELMCNLDDGVVRQIKWSSSSD